MKTFVAFLLGALLMLAVPALANHISEPTHPISGFELKIEDYAGTAVLACNGSDVATFDKFRISTLAMSAEALAVAEPSEHFDTGWQIDRKVYSSTKPNIFQWVKWSRVVWGHQNIPAWHFGDSTKFNTAYATITPGAPNGGSDYVLPPGEYRITAELLGRESGNHFVNTCSWTKV